MRRLAAVLDRRTADLARRADAVAPRPGLSVLAFSAGAGLYGAAVAEVAEVLPGCPLSPCPGAPPAVLGLFSHGGRVLAALDLLRLAGAGAMAPAALEPAAIAGGMLVVLRARDRRLALMVDRALGVIAVDPPVEADDARAVTSGAVTSGAVTWVGVHPAEGSADPLADTLALIDPVRLLAPLTPYAAGA